MAVAACAVLAAVLGPGVSAAAAASPGFTHTDTTQGCQTYSVPSGATDVTVTAIGAAGGAYYGLAGGAGGQASGQISVANGQSLYLCVDVGGGVGTFSAGSGGGASGVALGTNSLGTDFNSPLIVAGGGGGAGECAGSGGGSAGQPTAGSGGGCSSDGSSGGGGGDNTTGVGGAGGRYIAETGGSGSGSTSSGPGSGGNASTLYASGDAGGGAGYYGGGAGAGNSGGGGGTDYCDNSVTNCAFAAASAGARVIVQYLAPQTITFPANSVTYGQADFSPASSDSGMAITYTNISGQCTVADGGAELHITGAGSCTATATQAGDGTTYQAAAPVTTTFTIDKATVHVDANPASDTYGQSDPAPSSTLRASDFVGSDTASSSGISGSASCTIGLHAPYAGSYSDAINCAPGDLSAANYTFVSGNAADLTIDKAVLHVDANPAAVAYGLPDPTPTGMLRPTDFQYSDTPSNSGITGSASCTIASHSQDAGNYSGAISCGAGTLSSANYTFATGNPADLTIMPAAQTITFTAPSGVTYGDTDFDPGAVASSGLPVSYASSTTSVCTIAGGDLHVVSAGTCTVAATQGGDSNHNAAPEVDRTFTIAQKQVHVDATPQQKTYGSADPDVRNDYVLRASDFAGSDTASSSGITGSPNCSIASHAETPGTYPGVVSCAPGTLSAANYTFAAGNAAALTISSRAPSGQALATSGSSVEGQVLSVTGQQPGASYTYEWERCDSNGNDCVVIPGVTGSSYTLTGADVAHVIRVIVTTTDAGGTGQTSLTFSGGAVKPAAAQVTWPHSASRSGKTVDPGVQLSCPLGAGSCTANEQATAMVRPTGASKARRMTVGTARFSIPAGRSVKATFRLNQLGMTLLSDHGRLPVQVKLTERTQDGTQMTASRTITLHGTPAKYKVSAVRFQPGGTVSLHVRVTAPGRVNILLTAWKNNVATAARVLNPAPGRFVVARATAYAKKAGMLTLEAHPNAAGKALIAHPAYRLTFRLWVSYLPLDAIQANSGYYGLHP